MLFVVNVLRRFSYLWCVVIFQQWCQEGDCVVNPKAPPSVKSKCTYGNGSEFY